MTKISIVTPVFNGEKYIKETIDSVIYQSAFQDGRAELEYIICDGASTDGTINLVESLIAQPAYQNIRLISEPDLGMYDALSRGLSKVTGNIVAYINAGDYYHKCAFDVVLDVRESHPQTKWLTGKRVDYNEKSQIVYSQLPFRYRQKLFACGLYGTKLPCVQQESTFWDASLLKLLDFEQLSKFKYAGDFYLWLQFSQVCRLTIVDSYLGGWKIHAGQLSENMTAYLDELRQIASSPGLCDQMIATVDQLIWSLPPKLKKKLNGRGLLQFDHQSQRWC